MITSPFLNAFTSGWGVFAVGSVWTMGALFFENHLLKIKAEPHLSLVFDPNGQLFNSLHDDGRLRIFRVGVRNSGETVTDVSIKVAKINPELPWLFPMHELQQTHKDDGVSRFTVNKSTEPLVFVDVIYQRIHTADGVNSGAIGGRPYEKPFKKGETWQLDFRFAARGSTNLKSPDAHPMEPYRDHYLIWLAVDGAGAEEPQKFILQKSNEGQFEMKKTLEN